MRREEIKSDFILRNLLKQLQHRAKACLLNDMLAMGHTVLGSGSL